MSKRKLELALDFDIYSKIPGQLYLYKQLEQLIFVSSLRSPCDIVSSSSVSSNTCLLMNTNMCLNLIL